MKKLYQPPRADVERFSISGSYLTTSTGIEQGGEEIVIGDSEF